MGRDAVTGWDILPRLGFEKAPTIGRVGAHARGCSILTDRDSRYSIHSQIDLSLFCPAWATRAPINVKFGVEKQYKVDTSAVRQT